ncbi:MAG: hypothetical protein DHS80DRAFT_31141 [Piptocephalis tieghemiana]|nr:MAG: hypothetical protein DHS80DRAFT_31141 [Piptocephalis tieghemiana]
MAFLSTVRLGQRGFWRFGGMFQRRSPMSNVAPSVQEAATSNENQYFRVTLHRSPIGLPFKVRRTLDALGLGKKSSVAHLPCNKSSIGSLLKVKELVQVELTDVIRPKRQRVERGWTVLGNQLKQGGEMQ